MKTVALVICTCEHTQQDTLHGKNRRVANLTSKIPSDGTREVRCTVCKKIHVVSPSQLKG